MPHDLVYALNEALTVLSWHENLPKDEIPPRHIWWDSEAVEDWFRKVQEARDRRFGSGKKSESTFDQADDSPMTGNLLVNRDLLRPGGNGGRELPL